MQKPPLSLWVLDLLGSMLLALGIADHFGDKSLVPAALQLPGYGIVLMVLGAALVLPYIVWLIRRQRAAK